MQLDIRRVRFRSCRGRFALAPTLTIALAIALAADGARAADDSSSTPPEPLPLTWVLDRASTANPRIAADAAARDAARERARAAWSLDDPRISYEASNVPIGDWDFQSTPLSGHQLGLRQRLPFPGVLGNREQAARAGYEASRHELDDRRLRVAGAAEAAWSELGFAQRAVDITGRNIALLRQLAAIAEAKYRVGDGLQQDVIRAQVELTSLLEEELTRRAALATAEARVAELLDLPPHLALPRTDALRDESPVPPIEALLAGLEARSPMLLSLAARVDEAEKEARMARWEGYPDVDLGVGYRIRRDVPGDPVNGDDFVSAGVTFRLPVDRRRWNAKVAEANALARRARAAYRGAAASLRAEVRRAHAELARADAEGRLLATGLVPQAHQSLESSRSGYEVGRIDFLSLLDSQVSLLRAELRHVRALANRRVAFATLEAAAGEKLR